MTNYKLVDLDNYTYTNKAELYLLLIIQILQRNGNKFKKVCKKSVFTLKIYIDFLI